MHQPQTWLAHVNQTNTSLPSGKAKRSTAAKKTVSAAGGHVRTTEEGGHSSEGTSKSSAHFTSPTYTYFGITDTCSIYRPTLPILCLVAFSTSQCTDCLYSFHSLVLWSEVHSGMSLNFILFAYQAVGLTISFFLFYLLVYLHMYNF